MKKWLINFAIVTAASTVQALDIEWGTVGDAGKTPDKTGYTLADGRAFADVDEFKQLILAHPEQLARCVTEKIIAHLTGAQIQFADHEVVESIVQRAASNDYGLRTLVQEVIQSRVFTHQ